MKKICWWMGTDALTLVKNPPGNRIWHLKLIFYRLKWRILMRFFDEHWVTEKHLGEYLKKYRVKEVKIKHDEYKYGKMKKKKHTGFNILYYCPTKPVNLGGMKYIHWLYGYDVFLELEKNLTGFNFIHISGDSDMSKVYPLTDIYIRPNRHDGYARMIDECEANNIPVIKSENFKPDIKYFINEIKNYYSLL